MRDVQIAGVRTTVLRLGVIVAVGCGPTAAPPRVVEAPVVAEAAPVESASWAPDRSTFDPSVAPCDDFYQHVCGSWARTVPDVANFGSWARARAVARVRGVVDEILTGTAPGVEASDGAGQADVDRVRTFYASCMADPGARDRADEQVLGRVLAGIDKAVTRAAIGAVMRELHGLGVDAWFLYGAERDRADPTRYRGVIWQGDLGLRLGVYADRSAAAVARREEYRQLMARMFERIGVPRARAQRDAAAVLALETQLAAVSLGTRESYDPKHTEHPMRLEQLRALAPHIDWPAYLAMVGYADRAVNVTAPAYMKALDRVLATRPLEDLRAHLRWRVLDSLGPELPTGLAEERARVWPPHGGSERASQCQLATVRAVGVELSRQFSHRTLGERGRSNARKVAGQLVAAMADQIAATPWLSPRARAAAADRARKLDLKMGFPDRWPEIGSFGLARDAFLANVLAARTFEQQRIWKRANAPWQRLDWEMTVYPNGAPGMAAGRLSISNAFPDPFTNSIIFTAAWLQPPLFDRDAPLEVQLATFGAVFAHELVHVMDIHEFDSDGLPQELWTPEDLAAYTARQKCFIDQANQYVVIDDLHINGELTLYENVADASGVVFSYRVLERALGDAMHRRGSDGWTPAQRFFFAYAQQWCNAESPDTAKRNLQSDPHAPTRYRTNSPLSSMPEFASAFSCRPDAKMVRPAAERCVVW